MFEPLVDPATNRVVGYVIHTEKETTMSQGWECPKCNRVYAPFMMECPKCNVPTKTVHDLTDVPFVDPDWWKPKTY